MHKNLVREPIHPRKGNRGKLRKIEHHRLQANPMGKQLMLTPTNIMTHSDEPKQKIHQFFSKKNAFDSFSFFTESSAEQLSGSFRAIHTAHPDDSIRGFPLRCITPIKPFRRGIRSTSKVTKHTFQISLSKEDSPTPIRSSRRQMRENHQNLSDIIVSRPPCLLQNEEVEEFYKFKQVNEQPSSLSGTKDSEEIKLAGSKIEPFKKYFIRDVQKGSMWHHSSNRNVNK